MATNLRDKVVVITGASSGIGRLTALEFAEAGARVVLAARRDDELEKIARQCRTLGGDALVVPTDVTREAEMRDLALRAIERFGEVDVWVNNAAVFLFGEFARVPSESFRRVIETNFFGTVYGMRAILPHFRARDAGVLINVSSLLGKWGSPHLSAYVASKFAIRGLSESVRQELAHTGVHVCTVLPAAIDTPIYHQAANYTGHETGPLHPIYPPEDVAATIVALARSPKPRAVVGRVGYFAIPARALAPRLFERVYARFADALQIRERAAHSTHGNLFEPDRSRPAMIHGGWSRESQVPRRIARVVALGAVSLLAFGIYRRLEARAAPTRHLLPGALRAIL